MSTGIASGYVSITPATPVPLAGYSHRTAACAGIADDLEANVIVLRDAGRTMVLIAFDLLYVGTLLRGKIEAALQPAVRAEDLFLAASHTHFAPATDATLPALGVVAPAYVDMVAERVIGLVRNLLAGDFKPLAPAFGRVQANHAVNRRRQGWRLGRRYPFLRRHVMMKPNPRGPKDETLRLIRLGEDALIWHYACHPVLVPWMNHVSGDFVGVVRQALRRIKGDRAAVLFLQGFAADVYPSYASTLFGVANRLGHYLGIGRETVKADVWRSWSQSLADCVVEAEKQATDFVGDIAPSARLTFPVRELLPHDTTGKQVAVHRLGFGRVHVLGVSAEPAVAFASQIARAFPAKDVMCVGCIDGVFGYLPTAPMVAAGGYEAHDFLQSFGLTGPFDEQVERIVHDKLTHPALWSDARIRRAA